MVVHEMGADRRRISVWPTWASDTMAGMEYDDNGGFVHVTCNI